MESKEKKAREREREREREILFFINKNSRSSLA